MVLAAAFSLVRTLKCCWVTRAKDAEIQNWYSAREAPFNKEANKVTKSRIREDGDGLDNGDDDGAEDNDDNNYDDSTTRTSKVNQYLRLLYFRQFRKLLLSIGFFLLTLL